MKEYDKSYIEGELYEAVVLCAEVDYNVDNFGNIIFNNRGKVKQDIIALIENTSKKRNLPIEEIEEHLMQVCKRKMENKKDNLFGKELEEILSIIKGLETELEKTEKIGDTKDAREI